MSLSDVKICSKALNLLGEKSIDSLTEGTDRATICNAAYDLIRDDILSSYPWRFAMKKRKLTRAAAVPINEWKYSFVAPPDRLSEGALSVFTSASTSSRPTQNFEVFGNRIYSNDPEIWADYVWKIPEDQWPPYFNRLMVAAICAEIAYPVTDQQNIATNWETKAYGTPNEKRVGGLMGRARSADSMGNVSQAVMDHSLIDARLN